MFDFTKQELSQEEKVDYIFNTLKAQKRNARIQLAFKVAILLGVFYFFFIYIPSLPQENKTAFKETVTNFISSQISEIAKPMIEDISKDMINDMWKTNSEDLVNQVLDGSAKINSSKLEEFYKKHPELRK